MSADGLTVHTDPGTGITHPGWHGLMPPGSNGQGGGGCNGTPPEVPFEFLEIHQPTVLPLISKDVSTFDFLELSWSSPGATSLFPTPNCNAVGGFGRDILYVTIEVDGSLEKFAKRANGSLPLVNQTFAIPAGSLDVKRFDFQAMTYDEMFGPGGFGYLLNDQLYGSTIRVIQKRLFADGSIKSDVYTYHVYRWVSVIEANEAKARSGISAAFLKTLADGVGDFVRDKKVPVHLPKEGSTKFSSAAPFSIVGSGELGEGFSEWTLIRLA